MVWLSDYIYRKKVVVNSTTAGAQTNYQLKLVVGESSGASGADVHCSGYCLNFPNDIRFTKEDGETKHDYWVEGIEGITPNRKAHVWIEVAAIPSSGSVDFYMYYGKSGDTGESDGDSAFKFFDDEWSTTPLDLYATSSYDGFGILIKTGDDTILHFYRVGTSHGSDKGKIVKRTYTISTMTWSAASDVFVDSTYDCRDVCGGIIGSNIFLFFTRYNYGADTFVDLGYIKSTDLTGTSWGSRVVMSTSSGWRYNHHGHLEYLGGTTYIQPWFEHDGAGTWHAQYYKTIDSGVNWTTVTIYSGTTQWGEPCIVNIGNNKLLGIFRNGAGGYLGQATSSNNGDTWSSITNTNLGISTGGKPPYIIYDSESGNVIVMYHDRGDNKSKVSETDANTVFANASSWITPEVIDSGFAYNGYHSIVKIASGKYFFVYSKQVSDSDADIWGGKYPIKWSIAGAPSISGGIVSLANDDAILGKTAFGYNHAIVARAKANEQDIRFIMFGDTIGLNCQNRLGITNSDGDDPDVFDRINFFAAKNGSGFGSGITASDFRNTYFNYQIKRISGRADFYQGSTYLGNITNVANLPIIDLYPKAIVWDNSQESTLDIDWIFVRNYVSPEPIWGSWGAEDANFQLSDTGQGSDITELTGDIKATDSATGVAVASESNVPVEDVCSASDSLDITRYADITYYFNSKSTSIWNDPEKMVDGILTNFAYTVSDGDTEVLDGNTCPGTNLGTITKVEIRAYGYGDGDDRIDLTPVFTGGDGDEHQTTPGVSPASWGPYQDITSDTNHPSPWTWSDVQNLDCKVEFDKVAGAHTLYCAKVEIRVAYTYTPSGTPKFSSDTCTGSDAIPNIQFSAVDSGSTTESLTIEVSVSFTDQSTSDDAIALEADVQTSDTGLGSETILIGKGFTVPDVCSSIEIISTESNLTFTDVGQLSDIPELTGDIKATDSATGVTAIPSVGFSVVDTGSFVESLMVESTLTFTDQSTSDDVIALETDIQISDQSMSDEITTLSATCLVVDSMTGQTTVPNVGFSVTDTGSFADTVASESNVPVGDICNSNEITQLSAQTTVSDVTSSVESVTELYVTGAFDTSGSSDYISVQIDSEVSDYGQGASVISTEVHALSEDSGGFSENVWTTCSLEFLDSASSSEASFIGKVFTISDTCASIGLGSIQSTLSMSDTATSSEVTSLEVQLQVSDPIGGSDVIDLIVQSTVYDTISSSENELLEVQLQTSESGSAVDVTELTVDIEITDSVSGVTTVPNIKFSVLDTGQSDETITLSTTCLAIDSGQSVGVVGLTATCLAIDTSQFNETIVLSTTCLAIDTGQSEDIASLTAIRLATDISQSDETVDLSVTCLFVDNATGELTVPYIEFTVTDTSQVDETTELSVTCLTTDSMLGQLSVSSIAFSVTDNSQVVETIEISAICLAVDTSQVSETIGLVGEVKTTDSATGQSTVPSIGFSVVDTSSSVETVEAAPSVSVITDSGSFTDVVGTEGNILCEDTCSGYEITQLSMSTTVTDTVSSLEIVTDLHVTGAFDTSSSSDYVSMQVVLVSSDYGEGISTIGIETHSLSEDSGEFSESVWSTCSLKFTDSGCSDETTDITSVRTVTDQGQLGETITLSAICSAVDTGQLSEILGLSGEVKVTDSVSGVTTVPDIGFSVFDTGSSIETTETLTEAEVPDSGNFTDIAKTGDKVFCEDVSNGNETTQLSVYTTVSDTVSSSENVTDLYVMGIFDAGIFTGQVSVRKGHIVSDNCTSMETSNVQSSFSTFDTVSSLDNGLVEVQLQATDLGQSSDISSLTFVTGITDSVTGETEISSIGLSVFEQCTVNESLSVEASLTYVDQATSIDAIELTGSCSVIETVQSTEVIKTTKGKLATDLGNTTDFVWIESNVLLEDTCSVLDTIEVTGHIGCTDNVDTTENVINACVNETIDSFSSEDSVYVQEVIFSIETVEGVSITSISVSGITEDSGQFIDTSTATGNLLVSDELVGWAEAQRILTSYHKAVKTVIVSHVNKSTNIKHKRRSVRKR